MRGKAGSRTGGTADALFPVRQHEFCEFERADGVPFEFRRFFRFERHNQFIDVERAGIEKVSIEEAIVFVCPLSSAAARSTWASGRSADLEMAGGA
jgi:hypothetical protein